VIVTAHLFRENNKPVKNGIRKSGFSNRFGVVDHKFTVVIGRPDINAEFATKIISFHEGTLYLLVSE
jgi:hypothetical protein